MNVQFNFTFILDTQDNKPFLINILIIVNEMTSLIRDRGVLPVDTSVFVGQYSDKNEHSMDGMILYGLIKKYSPVVLFRLPITVVFLFLLASLIFCASFLYRTKDNRFR